MTDEGDATFAGLLERTHRAVIRGDLAALPALAEEMERRLPELSGQLSGAAALAAAAERNARCLEAAARGLRAARRQVQAAQDAALGLRTYDGAGRPRHVPTAAAAVARRI